MKFSLVIPCYNESANLPLLLERCKNPPHDFALDLYAYYQAKKTKLKIFRFPVRFGKRAHGVSHWNINWTAKRKFILRTIEFSLKLNRRLN